ncbi:MAG: hypothetical protein ACLQDV_27535 [Candidatus Binataceae bacterium]
MSPEIDGTKTESDQWAESKRTFIQARDDLMRVAERGTTKACRDVIADWTTVWPANMSPPMGGYPQRKTTFETKAAEYIELATSGALTKCHEQFVELRRQYAAAKGVVDLLGLTHLERKYLKAHAS